MASRKIPASMRQIIVKKLGTNFREVTEIVEARIPSPGPKQILVKNKFLGINASDINYAAGRYDPTKKPPFTPGFEGLGEVVSVGSDAKSKLGQTVVYSKFGAFQEYIAVDESTVMPVPSCDPAFLTFMVSGLTASIALEKLGRLSPGNVVLVTAAAGGTGQFAVQLAKSAGCHVIGTCSNEDKVAFLKSIGCDRAVNYNKESLNDVLSKEYRKGVDVVYESVGNEMLDAALKNIALFGRIIVIGSISNYATESESEQSLNSMGDKSKMNIPVTLLQKSASMNGFFFSHYRADIKNHLLSLTKQYKSGSLKVFTDKGVGVPTGPFVGLEKVVDAIEYMYSRKNVGKIVVELTERSSL
ncbi:prostaglandin reductase-3-like [Physella acuta]|uniref:prostaglandin reductase-3-like n=1 Tax=Physella acuta TaxID=109671 RepID=UPI0027DC5B07|nr:prostaglandin reductase-3-like [Physella acuta]